MDLIRELMLRPEALDKSPTAVIRLGGIYEGGWMDRERAMPPGPLRQRSAWRARRAGISHAIGKTRLRRAQVGL
jgi:hypothetical protein